MDEKMFEFFKKAETAHYVWVKMAKDAQNIGELMMALALYTDALCDIGEEGVK